MMRRREAMALTMGLALSSAAAERAAALGRKIPRFVPRRDDLEHMTAKLDALRYHWNRATLDKFFAEHCTEQVEVNFYVNLGGERRGGRWSSPDAIRMFHQAHPKMSSDYSGVMSAPSGGSTIYTVAEFERTPPPPPGPDEEISLVGGPFGPVAIALQLNFETEISRGVARLARGKRIVDGLSLRNLGDLNRWFDD